MVWEQKSKYWLFLALKLHHWALSYVPIIIFYFFFIYELIFHAYKEENRIDTFSFIEKSFSSGNIGEKKI